MLSIQSPFNLYFQGKQGTNGRRSGAGKTNSSPGYSGNGNIGDSAALQGSPESLAFLEVFNAQKTGGLADGRRVTNDKLILAIQFKEPGFKPGRKQRKTLIAKFMQVKDLPISQDGDTVNLGDSSEKGKPLTKPELVDEIWKHPKKPAKLMKAALNSMPPVNLQSYLDRLNESSD